jgi:hypothetical protein
VKFLPTKFRLSRKLAIIVAGVVVLTGASGAAAIFVGRDAILGPPQSEISGVACTTVTTLRVTRDGQNWLRKYVRSEALDGSVRVKTALRVAGAMSNHEEADLYQVILLDAAGPVNRADMRGRAIGAEVLFARNPAAVPGMKAPFVARYIDGPPAGNGEFYGTARELRLDEIKTIVTGMEDRADCIDPSAAEGEGGHTADAGKGAEAHGKTEVAGHAEAAQAESHEVAASQH